VWLSTSEGVLVRSGPIPCRVLLLFECSDHSPKIYEAREDSVKEIIKVSQHERPPIGPMGGVNPEREACKSPVLQWSTTVNGVADRTAARRSGASPPHGSGPDRVTQELIQ